MNQVFARRAGAVVIPYVYWLFLPLSENPY